MSEDYDINSPYFAKLFKEQILKMNQKDNANLSFDYHIQAIIVNIPSLGLADIVLNSTNIADTPVIHNVKVRNNVLVNVGDQVRVLANNGSLNDVFIDYNKTMGMTVNFKKGTTSNRPTGNIGIGHLYLDITLNANGKPIWWNGSLWVDSTGASV